MAPPRLPATDDCLTQGRCWDVTPRASAGTLSNRVKEATSHVISVGALSVEFQRMLGMVRSKYLPGRLHGCEGSAVSVSLLGASELRWHGQPGPKKFPMTNTPALLNLLDSPWCTIRG